jgi:hypothetical protein
MLDENQRDSEIQPQSIFTILTALPQFLHLHYCLLLQTHVRVKLDHTCSVLSSTLFLG